jgi:DHA2 family multidrug resistance protein-like MFS transporter
VAHRIGGEGGQALEQAAREAFVHGMHLTLAASALMLLLGALAALRLPASLEGQCAEEPARVRPGDRERSPLPAGSARP